MAIRDGSSLYWDNYFFAGGTLLQFTGPVFHWVATAITLVERRSDLRGKGGRGRLRASRPRSPCSPVCAAPASSRTAAALGCLFFAGSFFVTYLVSIRSTFPQIVVLATLPAMLYGIERVLAAPRFGRGWVVLCLAAIVLIGDHQPTAVMAAVLLGLYVLARIGREWLADSRRCCRCCGGRRHRARQRFFPGPVRARAALDRRGRAEPAADFAGLAAAGRAAELRGVGPRRRRHSLYRLSRPLDHRLRARRRPVRVASAT